MSEKILVVDDEERILTGIRRSLHGKFSIVTALGAEEALEKLDQDPDFAVVMSDMRMPNIDGAEFLSRVRKKFPALVRLMLTGNNDQETAKKAVNEGAVHRFLNKPCSAEELTEALSTALDRHRSIQIERDVLDRTLGASVAVMTDILSIAQPENFGASARVAKLSVDIAKGVGGIEEWTIRTAASLGTIGHFSISDDIIAKRRGGGELTRQEAASYTEHAEFGAELLGKIPRMEPVAEIVRYQERRFDGTGAPADGPKGEDIPLGARILLVASQFELLRSNGWSTTAALEKLMAQRAAYDPRVLDALRTLFDDEEAAVVVQRVPVGKLTRSMTIHEDVETVDGVLLVCKGQAVTVAVATHLRKLTERGALDVDPLVSMPAR